MIHNMVTYTKVYVKQVVMKQTFGCMKIDYAYNLTLTNITFTNSNTSQAVPKLAAVNIQLKGHILFQGNKHIYCARFVIWSDSTVGSRSFNSWRSFPK